MTVHRVQCSAVQCSAVQCSAVQCSAVQCSAVQCSAVQCSAVQMARAFNKVFGNVKFRRFPEDFRLERRKGVLHMGS